MVYRLRKKRWFPLAAAIYLLGTAALGWYSLARQFPGLPAIDYLLRTFQLFSLGGVGSPDPAATSLNAGLLVARLLAATITLTAGTKLLREALGERWTAGRVRFTSDHVVVCGLGTKGRLLISALRARRRAVVAIGNNPRAEGIITAHETGAWVLTGDATDPALLARAHLAKAAALVAISGLDQVNVEIARQAIASAPPGRATPLRCAVHLASPRARSLLQQSGLFSRTAQCEVRFFNLDELTARVLLTKDLPGGAEHLVLVGFGSLGESIAVQYAHVAHHPGWVAPKLTVVTPGAAAAEGRLLGRYPDFRRVCALEFVECNVGTKALATLPLFAALTPGAAVVVAEEDDTTSLLTALELLQICREPDVPIYARMRDSAGLEKLTAIQSASRAKCRLIPFGKLQEVCSPEVVLDERLDHLAQAIHEAYQRNIAQAGDGLSSRAKQPWESLDEDLREASRRQADHHTVKLAAIRAGLSKQPSADLESFQFTADELSGLARTEHNRWCAERHLSGWTYGPERDDGRKIHPLLIPWEQLDDTHRQRNRAAIQALPQMFGALGLGIERLPESRPEPPPTKSSQA